ncbi:MAG: antibiotic biosynthesis monooxygenase [Nocardioides sp.]
MIIGRFRVQARPERSDEIAAAMLAVEAPSRLLPGVVSFDIVRSVSDPHSYLAIEVFADRAAFDAQNAQTEVAELLELIAGGAAVGDYEWRSWEVDD